jgi:CubicO group peptidase (beta-lactamase class C family)
MTRFKLETALAVLFAAAIILAGGAAFYFFSTTSVHTDPGTVPSTAATAPVERDSAAVEKARRQARALVVEENLPSLSVAVARDGQTVWAEAFGWADVGSRTPATPVTRYRLGSVSKTLTAAAAGLLHDRGRIDLDAPVQKYVTTYPQKQWAVSTRQLMGDVGGVHHLRGNEEQLPDRHCTTLDEALPIFANDPLLFRPGTAYRYSIYGWILTSAVVEAAAGEPFARFMIREVFEPLGMEHTRFDDTDGVQGRASLYFPRTAMRTDLGLQEAPEADYSCWAGAAVFQSTPSDMVRFGSAMLKPGLLTAETIALLKTPFTLESGASTGFALGWKVESVPLGGTPVQVLSHRGNPMGGSISLILVPEFGLAIAAFSNVSHAKGVAPFALKVAEAFAKPASEHVRLPTVFPTTWHR